MTNKEKAKEQQTNIHGNVDGSVLSGHFDGAVASGHEAEAVDMRGAQGALYKPSGPVTQYFADQITVVSPERIAMEMRQILVAPTRSTAVRLLLDTGLAPAILPEIVPANKPGRRRLEHTLTVLDRLEAPGFPLAWSMPPGRGNSANGGVCRTRRRIG